MQSNHPPPSSFNNFSAGRVSRYRSQRGKKPDSGGPASATSATTTTPPVPAVPRSNIDVSTAPSHPKPDLATMNTIQRSRSRYRHARPPSGANTEAVPTLPNVSLDRRLARVGMRGDDTQIEEGVMTAPGADVDGDDKIEESGRKGDAQNLSNLHDLPHRSRRGQGSGFGVGDGESGTAAHEVVGATEFETQEISHEEAKRQRKAQLKLKADEARLRARQEAEREQSGQRKVEDSGRRELASGARKDEEMDCTRQESWGKSPVVQKHDFQKMEDYPSLRRDNVPATSVPGVRRTGTRRLPEHPPLAGTASLGPGVDAPISAVNAGERRVLIEFNRTTIRLPVTPTTTPIDLINSIAATCSASANTDIKSPNSAHPTNATATDINPTTSVLLEYFGKVGIQRPLRTYEHVRAVLNSWDTDSQNSLILVPSASSCGLISSEDPNDIPPKDQPPSFTCQMYHSQKLGHWSKKWIILRSDGRLLVSKKAPPPDFATTQPESEHYQKQTKQSSTCHLSDYDIYVPTPKHLSRKIQPPKKICFAIKSQQKSAMFLSTEDYVHFFCSGDKKVAAEFWGVVRGWRSWYLVHVLGEGNVVGDGGGGSGGASGEAVGIVDQRRTIAGDPKAVGMSMTRGTTLVRGVSRRRPSASGGPTEHLRHTSKTAQHYPHDQGSPTPFVRRENVLTAQSPPPRRDSSRPQQQNPPSAYRTLVGGATSSTTNSQHNSTMSNAGPGMRRTSSTARRPSPGSGSGSGPGSGKPAQFPPSHSVPVPLLHHQQQQQQQQLQRNKTQKRNQSQSHYQPNNILNRNPTTKRTSPLTHHPLLGPPQLHTQRQTQMPTTQGGVFFDNNNDDAEDRGGDAFIPGGLVNLIPPSSSYSSATNGMRFERSKGREVSVGTGEGV